MRKASRKLDLENSRQTDRHRACCVKDRQKGIGRKKEKKPVCPSVRLSVSRSCHFHAKRRSIEFCRKKKNNFNKCRKRRKNAQLYEQKKKKKAEKMEEEIALNMGKATSELADERQSNLIRLFQTRI